MNRRRRRLLRLSMALGGNAPFIVFEDADIDDAVTGAMNAKMRNAGEACTAANRFHVAAPIADEFAQKLAAKMGALTKSLPLPRYLERNAPHSWRSQQPDGWSAQHADYSVARRGQVSRPANDGPSRQTRFTREDHRFAATMDATVRRSPARHRSRAGPSTTLGSGMARGSVQSGV